MDESTDDLARLRSRIAALEAENAGLKETAAQMGAPSQAAGLRGEPERPEEGGGSITEQRLRLILESAVEYAILTADLEGKITTWNEGARRILRYEESEILGRSVATIFVPEDRAAGAPELEMRQCLVDGRAEDERWHLRSDGTRFLARGLLMPLRQDGIPRGFLKILRDQTRERKAEEALRGSQARLRIAASAAHMGFWELDLASRTFVASGVCKANFGRPPEGPFSYEEFLASLHPEDREGTDGALSATSAEPRELSVDCRAIWPDGSTHWIELRGQSFPGLNGGPARMLGVSLDVTARKKTEQDLQAAVAHQRVLVREINHRVKNSLQLVANLLQLQTMGSKDPDVRNALNHAVTRVLVVAQIHDRLWHQDDAQIVELAGFVRDLCGDLQKTAPGCPLRCQASEIDVEMRIAVPLGLILNELVTNAFKYGCPANQGEVQVAVDRHPKDAVRVIVRDYGPGLPPGFEPAQTSGSLGMRLITGMLRQLEGELRVESAEPGTRFVLTIPL